MIKSIEQITVTIPSGQTSATGTLTTTVDTTRSHHFWRGCTGQQTSWTADKCAAKAVLTDGSTVTVTRNTSDASNSITVKVTVIEFQSALVKAVRTGSITIGSGATSNTDTITSVDADNSIAFHCGQTSTYTAQNYGFAQAAVQLTNPTTVTAFRGASDTATVTVPYVVIEFQPGVIWKRQQTTVTIGSGSSSGTANLSTSVDTTLTACFFGGWTCASSSGTTAFPRVILTDGSTLTATRGGTPALVSTAYVTVVEFNPAYVKSVTRQETTILANNTSATYTIGSAVDTGRTLVHFLGNSYPANATNMNTVQCDATLTDATTVTVTRVTASATQACIVSWEAIEWRDGHNFRPISDISAGSWLTDGGSGSNLYAAVDESAASDSDYVKSSTILDTSTDTLEIKLGPAVDPGVLGHGICYRYRKTDIAGTLKNMNLTVSLRQGSSTEIAAWTHTSIGTGWVTAIQKLTSPQESNISDYTDLRLRFVATGA